MNNSDNLSPVITLRSVRPSSYADQVYGKILSGIMTGQFGRATKLPPEKDLCEMFGVSRPVVRSALHRLALDGLVAARRGSGTYVISSPSARLGDITDLTGVSRVLRYLELRLAVEGAAAALAAQRRSSEALGQIVKAHETFLAEMSADVFLPASDRALHVAIAEATGNEFFPLALENAEASLADFMTLSLSLTKAGSAQRVRLIMQEHTNIVGAIKAQDAAAAKVAMEYHILQAKRRLTDRSYEP